MAKHHPSEVFRLGDALTPAEKLVVIALADYGAKIHPSHGRLAMKTGFDRSTIVRVVDSLRRKGVIQTKGYGKALTYTLHLSHHATAGCCTIQQVVLHDATGGVAPCNRDPIPQMIPQPNPAAADAAAGGWEVPEGLQDRIRQRDPRAEFVAQARVCRRIMAQHGLTLEEAQRTWLALCRSWADTGNNAYEVLAKQTLGLEEGRSPRALLLHRLKEVLA